MRLSVDPKSTAGVDNEIVSLMNYDASEKIVGANFSPKTSKANLIAPLIEETRKLEELYKLILKELLSPDKFNIAVTAEVRAHINSMFVCESLTKILNEQSSEKGALEADIMALHEDLQRSRRMVLELQTELKQERDRCSLRDQCGNERKRIIKDVKARCRSYKDRLLCSIKERDKMRVINQELHCILHGYREKNTLLVKEIGGLRDSINSQMLSNSKNLQDGKDKLSEKTNLLVDIASLKEEINRKSRIILEKDRVLDVLNDKLGQFIRDRDKESEMVCRLKEDVVHHEARQKDLQEQNCFLSEKLGKFINSGKSATQTVDEGIISELQKKVHKYKVKAKKYGKLFKSTTGKDTIGELTLDYKQVVDEKERLAKENQVLQDKIESGNKNNGITVEKLFDRIEGLLSENVRLKEELVMGKLLRKDGSIQRRDDVAQCSYPDNRDTGVAASRRELAASSNFKNFYDVEQSQQDIYTSVLDATVDENPRLDESNVYQQVAAGFNHGRHNPFMKLIAPNRNNGIGVVRPIADKYLDKAKVADDSYSESSDKSIQQMIERTQKVRGKFRDLEKQLENIKFGEGSREDKIKRQLKEYKNYYINEDFDITKNEDVF